MSLKPLALAALALAATLTTLTSAHPGERLDVLEELAKARARHAVADINNDALSQCNDLDEVRERRERAMTRRLATFNRLRAERGIDNGKY